MEIKIDFKKPPRKGRTQVIFRCHSEDKSDIDEAAEIMGMDLTKFIRTIALQAARTIISNKVELMNANVQTED